MHRLPTDPDHQHPNGASRLDANTLAGLGLAALGLPSAELAEALGTSVEHAIACESDPSLMSFDERVRLYDALERRSHATPDPAVHDITTALGKALWPHARTAARPSEGPAPEPGKRRESA